MAFTLLILAFAAIVIYIFWVLLNPRKKTSRKKPAKKQISKKNNPALKGKKNKQQAALPSADQIRKEKRPRTHRPCCSILVKRKVNRRHYRWIR